MPKKPKIPGRAPRRTGKVVQLRDAEPDDTESAEATIKRFKKKASPNESRSADIVFTDKDVTQAEVLRAKYADNFELFAKECLTIIDRDNPSGAALVPFAFSASQRALDKFISDIGDFNIEIARAKQKAGLDVPMTHLPIETVVLKARKVFASTYFRGRAFWLNEFHPGHNDMVMAHDKAVAENLNEIMLKFTSNWKESVPGLRTLLDRASATTLKWEHGSQTIVKTAGAKSKGSSQGYTYHFVQLSELSRYPNGSTEVASATTACATYREIHFESTARGENEFKTYWDNALWLHEAKALFRNGQPFPRTWNKKFKFFWGWWQDPAYRILIQDHEKEAILENLDDDEKMLIKEHNLSPEQLAWRRDKIANECSQQRDLSPRDFFKQEYPANPDEAFVSKGAAVFPREPLVNMLAAVKPIIRAIESGSKYRDMPAFCGHLVPTPLGFVEQEVKDIRGSSCIVWERPKPRHSYIISVDTAEGNVDGDDSVIGVYDRTNGMILREVARIGAKIRPDDLATLAHYFHLLFNRAFVIPERTGLGIYTSMELVKRGCGNVYFQQSVEQVGGGTYTVPTPGFSTNKRTKPLIIETMTAMLRDGLLELRHPDAIKQAMKFQLLDGTYAAPSGEHDDYVSADALACYGHQPDVGPPVWAGLATFDAEVADAPVLTGAALDEAYFKQQIKRQLEAAQKKNTQEERQRIHNERKLRGY